MPPTTANRDKNRPSGRFFLHISKKCCTFAPEMGYGYEKHGFIFAFFFPLFGILGLLVSSAAVSDRHEPMLRRRMAKEDER